MSSLSDMMSVALAGLLSAALVHFGASDGDGPRHKPQPAAYRKAEKPRPAAQPFPQDDERFAPANPDAAPAVRPVGPPRHLPGHPS